MKPREKQIGTSRYRVMMLDHEKAEDSLIDILKMLGPTLASLFEKLQGTGLKGLQELMQKKADSREFVGLATAFLREFSSGFDKATYRHVCQNLAEATTVSVDGGKKWPRLVDVQGELYRGNLQEKWAWLGFALEVNFAGFFAGISSAAAPVLGAVLKDASHSSSPPESDGVSGES